MPFGTSFSHQILNHFFGGGNANRSATVKIALFTTAPDFLTGAGGVEVADPSYARVTMDNDTTNFPAASARKKVNGVRVNFASLTNSATVVAWGMFDVSNTWMIGANLTSAKTINGGDPIYFDPGDLVIEFT